MKSLTVTDGYLLVLAKDELIIETLEHFFKAENIESGYINGLGAVSEAELGFYDLKAKQYQWTKFDQTHEITSLSGTLTETGLHLHVTLAGRNYQAIGGHLKEAKVGGTCEIYLRTFGGSLHRTLDELTGLNLLDI